MKTRHSYFITVGPTDTDSYNIVHHPMYFVWAEAAVYDYVMQNRSAFPQLREGSGFGCRLEQLQSKFHMPGRLYDRLELQTVCKTSCGADGLSRFAVRICREADHGLLVSMTCAVRLTEKEE